MAKAQKKSTFHKHFMTVTPLSKAIALALFILLPFLGFYLGMQYQKQVDTFMSSQQIVQLMLKNANPTPFPPHYLK